MFVSKFVTKVTLGVLRSEISGGCHTVVPQNLGGNQELIMSTRSRGHDVVVNDRRLIGTISDVLYDKRGDIERAVVDLGLLRSTHFLPVVSGHKLENGESVPPFDKQMVSGAPKAHRHGRVDPGSTRPSLRTRGLANC